MVPNTADEATGMITPRFGMKTQLGKRIEKPPRSLLKLGLLIVTWSLILSPYLNAGGNQMRLAITSSAFSEGGMIPRQYSCDGPDISPELSWQGAR